MTAANTTTKITQKVLRDIVMVLSNSIHGAYSRQSSRERLTSKDLPFDKPYLQDLMGAIAWPPLVKMQKDLNETYADNRYKLNTERLDILVAYGRKILGFDPERVAHPLHGLSVIVTEECRELTGMLASRIKVDAQVRATLSAGQAVLDAGGLSQNMKTAMKELTQAMEKEVMIRTASRTKAPAP